MRRAAVLVAGAGPAGVCAAVQLRRLGITPLLIDKTGNPGGLLRNARRIENYPGFEEGICGTAFIDHLERMLIRWEIPVITDELFTLHQEGDRFIASLTSGEMETARVILATGTHPELPEHLRDTPHHVYTEVYPLLHTDPRGVIVIGGGEAALDFSLSLADRKIPVEVAVRGTRLKAAGVFAKEVSTNPLVTIRFNSEVVGFSPTGDPLVLWNGHVAERRGYELLVAIGRRSTCADFHLEDARSCFTKQQGLFIAGDMRMGGLGQLGCAVGDGLWAAQLAAKDVP